MALFHSIVIAGAFIVAYGAFNTSYWQMLLGRFVFGLGGDSFFVGKAIVIANWFKGGELAFAFGITLSAGRIGSLVNGIAIPWAVLEGGVPFAFQLGVGVCLLSLLGTISVILLDAWATKRDKSDATSLMSEERFKMRDLFDLSLPFWLVVANCACLYSTVITYLIISPGIIESKYGFSTSQAGQIFMLPFLICAVLSPLMGIYIDKNGMRGKFSKSKVVFYLL